MMQRETQGATDGGQGQSGPASSVEGAGEEHVLASEIQSKLGQKLQEAYAEVIAEPVPDRFLQLLDDLEAMDGPGADATPSGSEEI